MAEIVDGAGGSMGDVAFIVATYIAAVVPSAEVQVCGPHDFFLQGPLLFVINVDRVDKPPDVGPTGQCELGPLCGALVHYQIVKKLTLVTRAFGAVNIGSAATTLIRCFMILERIFTNWPAEGALSDAIYFGLFPAIILCAMHTELARRVQPFLLQFICDILPVSTIYYHRLSPMKRAFGEIQDLVTTPGFVASEFYSDWQKFAEVAYERLALLESFDRQEIAVFKACDNMALLCMHKYTNEVLVTSFDYSKGRVQIDVEPITHSRAARTIGSSAGRAWPEELSRVARSNGKTEIHLMIVGLHGKLRWFVVPLRTNSSNMHYGLKTLAASIPAGADESEILAEFAEKIQILVNEEGEDVVRIHS
ncbi:hypothetical protein B0H17DRAFT_1198120 [Mycena rosella]|uniref:Uncharacterized protein n=1 Tax=Mycena rosella TaxID=1033263 RepID=A0AAD7DRR4_MYCRO|nr:hypothetical protein B0H17DRAFT_1198120 [Mycena rosella]